ncbi:MAG: AzlD domain-containing protein [Spirochaetes bacterium]|nr:AzlD domain-containing protein [Spirochaetota bacterium]
MTHAKIYIAIGIIGVITFFTRLFPFVFLKKNPGPAIEFFEKNIPPMIMLILVVYCLKEINWVVVPFGIPEILCIILTSILHIWKGNSILSIFSGTILYMLLIQSGIII